MLIAFPMFSFTVFDWLVGLATLVVFAMLLSVFFLYINLWFPRFDYHHEVEVVKQSLAALLAVFGGFGLLGGFLWLVLDPLSGFEPTLQMTIILMIETVGLLIAVIHLRKNANRYYQQLSI
jgi:hypothetical protein